MPYSRYFSTYGPKLEEMKFLVAEGVYMTRSEVQAIDPTERTVAQWRLLVDWDLVKQRPYVIVDPMDPVGLLYLSQKDYLAYAKVSASTDFPFMVICRPGIKRPESLVTKTTRISSTDPFQNSPWGVKWEGRMRQMRFSWSTFCRLRNRIHLLVNKLDPKDKMVSENLNSITRTVLVWARTLAHYAEVKNAGAVPWYLIPYTGYLKRILSTQGQMALVLHLKVALFALYSFVSGNPLTSTYALGSAIRLDRSGLPVCWGPILRRLIRGNKLPYIRLMASLLNIYRAMDAPHKAPDISSIIGKHPDLSENFIFSEFRDFVRDVFPNILRQETKMDLTFEYETGLGLIIRSAGANVSGPSMSGINLDAQAWFNQPENHVKQWFDLHRDREASRLMELVFEGNHFASDAKDDSGESIPKGITPAGLYMATRTPFSANVDPTFVEKSNHIYDRSRSTPIVLGRLHAIDEPAGKVRVVAICDYWTQVAMKPVHDHLFKILKKMGTDATFDQSGIVDRYYQRGLSPHWSFDLKSATDKIPLALYIEVMTVLLRAEGEDLHCSRQRAELWAKIMTDRDFLTPLKDGYARYGTGQPMGALSSWASMAMVHHALVQFAAYRAKPVEQMPSWYQDYLVLGDDIDIAQNHLVAENYQHICGELAIIIGLLKSLHSKKNCFEFANMRFSPDGNISPLSLKEELASTTWIARLEYAKRILARFGTHYASQGMALLRKATTVAQWAVLTPELSGTRGDTQYLNAVRFLLENPFTRLNSNEVVPVTSIVSWLAYLLPSQDREELVNFRNDTLRISRFESVVAWELIQSLDMEVKDRLSRIPSPRRLGSYFDGNDRGKFLDKFFEVSKFNVNAVTGKNGDVRGEPNVMMPRNLKGLIEYIEDDLFPKFGNTYIRGIYQDHATIMYNAYCFMKHNADIESDLEDLKRDVMRLSHYLRDPWDPVQVREGAEAFSENHPFGKEVASIYDAALSLWARLNSMPKVIEPDFDVPINDWLAPEPEVKAPYFEIKRYLDSKVSVDRVLTIIEERTRGPIRAIARAFARETGLIIPSLPYLAFEKSSMKGNTWDTLMSSLAKESANARSFVTSYQFGERLNRSAKKAKAYWSRVVNEDEGRWGSSNGIGLVEIIGGRQTAESVPELGISPTMP